MPIHDWTRVDAGTFHAFHLTWICRLAGVLNNGDLPAGFYSMPEQAATLMQMDILTRERTARGTAVPLAYVSGGVALTETPPRSRFRFRPNPRRRPRLRRYKPKSVVIRHTNDHRVVAVIEIVSQVNKDRRDHVRNLVAKVVQCIEADIGVLLIHLLPATRHDPHGIHGAVWSAYDTRGYEPPADGPLTLASYIGRPGDPEAFVEPVAVGQDLPDMPLFLSTERYVYAPLAGAYQLAWRELPAFVLEDLDAPPRP